MTIPKDKELIDLAHEHWSDNRQISPRNLQQDPRFTDPEKTRVSNSSSLASYLGVRWDSVPFNQHLMEYQIRQGWLHAPLMRNESFCWKGGCSGGHLIFLFVTCIKSMNYYTPVNSHSNGKSLLSIGNTSSKGPFSIAMLVYQRV